jgi:hypothetical protein
MDDSPTYREVAPGDRVLNFSVPDTELERFVVRLYDRLFDELRRAGVVTVFPNRTSGRLLFEEDSLLRALAIELDADLEACRAKARERVILTSGETGEDRTFWSEDDVLGSGVLWLSGNTLVWDVTRELREGLMNTAAYQALERRHAPPDEVFTGFSEIELAEISADVSQVMDRIFPGFAEAVAPDPDDDDEPEQPDLFAE